MKIPSVKAVEIMHSYLTKALAMSNTDKLQELTDETVLLLVKCAKRDLVDGEEYEMFYEFIMDLEDQLAKRIAR